MLPEPGYYWPTEAFQGDNDDLDALKRAFAQLGYAESTYGTLDAGFQKVPLRDNCGRLAPCRGSGGNWRVEQQTRKWF
jgi:hypothetical protein